MPDYGASSGTGVKTDPVYVRGALSADGIFPVGKNIL